MSFYKNLMIAPVCWVNVHLTQSFTCTCYITRCKRAIWVCNMHVRRSYNKINQAFLIFLTYIKNDFQTWDGLGMRLSQYCMDFVYTFTHYSATCILCSIQDCPVIHPSVIVRCRMCRAYINPYVSFIDSRHWRCNLCFRPNTCTYLTVYNLLVQIRLL